MNWELVCEDLIRQGYSVQKSFFSKRFCKDFLEEQQRSYQEGEFRQAGIGKGSSFQVRPEIRSDYVLWFDSESLSPVQMQYRGALNEYRQSLNRNCFLGLRDFECHFAIYPVGSFYKKHLDQFQKVAYRQVTCILYLNENWKDTDAGELKIFLEPSDQEEESYFLVKPEMGTFVSFMSAEIAHEVLVTKRSRYSITGWMTDQTKNN